MTQEPGATGGAALTLEKGALRVEVPAGGALNVDKHMYEKVVFVVEGRDNGLDQVEIHPYRGGKPKARGADGTAPAPSSAIRSHASQRMEWHQLSA